MINIGVNIVLNVFWLVVCPWAVRHGYNPIVVVLNNKGYTTERFLQEGPFNDILNWNYHRLPDLLGKIKATTATAFDTGVYLIVIGLVLMIFEGLGDERTEPADLAEADDPTPAGEGTR